MKQVLALVILLSTSLLLSGAEKSDLYKYIPASCNTLVGIDVKNIAAIPVLKSMVEAPETGENILENVHSIIIALNTAAIVSESTALQKQPDLMALFDVKPEFTVQKLIESFPDNNELKIKKTVVDGVNVVTATTNGGELAVAQFTDDLIAAGSVKMLKESISLKNATSTANISKNSSLTKVANKQKNMFWIVGEVPKLQTTEASPPGNPMTIIFETTKLFALNLNFIQPHFILDCHFLCNDSAAVDKLKMTLQMISGFLTASDQAPVKSEQIELTQNKSTVRVKISLDLETIMSYFSLKPIPDEK